MSSQKIRAKARSYAKTYASRGVLVIDKCAVCGEQEEKLYLYHQDYSRILDVVSLCQKCHKKARREKIYFSSEKFCKVISRKYNKKIKILTK